MVHVPRPAGRVLRGRDTAAAGEPVRYVVLALGAIWIVISTVTAVLFFVCVAAVLSCAEPVRQGHSVEWLVTAPVAPVAVAACPDDMVEVNGWFCPFVTQTCLKGGARCAAFAPSVCHGLRVPMHYCVDRYEYPNRPGTRPQSWISGKAAAALASASGKRLCTRDEWTFACEGEEMQPYPYWPGLVRRNDVCNFSNKPPNVFLAHRPGDPMSKQLDSLLVPSGSMPSCVSPWGLYDQVGNIDEWVVEGLMGGHVFGFRNRCRAITTGHGKGFSWYETGARFCRDI